MKNRHNPVSFSINLLLASCLLVTGVNVEAKGILRKLKNTGKSVVNSTTKTVEHSANTIAATAQDDMKVVASTAKSTYSMSAQEVTNGYNASVAALNAALNAALLAAYKGVGNEMLKGSRSKVTSLTNTFRNLDDDGMAALNRIVDAISSKQLNASVVRDMQVLGKQLNLQNAGQVGANVPNALKNSNFGIQVESTQGLGIGVGDSYGIAMNIMPDAGGNFKIALLQGKSVSAGLQADDSAGVSLSWSPGSVEDSGGNSVGLAFELAADGGAAIGLSWSAVTNFKDLNKISPIPGISIALVGGDSVKVDLVGGYTKVLTTMQIAPGSAGIGGSAPKSTLMTPGK